MSAPSNGRKLPLRRWLAIGFIVTLLSFILPFVLIFGTIYHSGYKEPSDDLDWARTQAMQSLDLWTDPTWQSEMKASLDDRDVEAVYRINGAEVFSTSADPFARSTTKQLQIQRLDETASGASYEADFLTDSETGPPEALKFVLPFALLSMLSMITGIAVFVRRTVVDPLAATSAAAGRVAVGELDVELPYSPIREVAELNTTFSGMSTALKRSLAQQVKLEEERRLFIGAIAHDLRTPLFSLRGSLEGLATGIANTPEKQERYLTVAREKADNLERLISDLFDFTRVEYLEQAPHRERLDLNDVLERAAVGFSAQSEAKAIVITFDPGSPPIAIAVDEHMLTRAIENVLDNAIRYTPQGGTITIRSGTRAGQAWFTIADTGPGITADDLPRIFTPLFRSETSRNRQTGGAGLGLAIARTMLRAHGGDLTARNGDEGGAVFEGTIGHE